jgi:rhamnose transport system permease protein
VFAVVVVIVALLAVGMQRLRWGRRLYAVGSNPEAATQAGLPTRRLVFGAFVACGALSGLAGFLFLARFGTITVVAGQGLELDSVAAAVVGGVSVLGGSGTLVGALLGAVLIDVLDQSLVRVPQVSEFWRNAVLGALILVAVVADVAIGRRFRRRWSAEARPHTKVDEPPAQPAAELEASDA